MKSKEIQDEIAQLEKVEDTETFQSAVESLQRHMKKGGCSRKALEELKNRAYYLPNDYSAKNTKDSMNAAKKRVIEYLNQISDEYAEDDVLLQVLNNYYLFLENLIERQPHGKGGICEKQLKGLKITNEYDIQHLLYAYIKPLYPMARAEVNEDTGYGVVRTDIFLDDEHVIEVKCTRDTMKLKKLTEEIEADMVHYKAKNIYFFIYDKEKIIQNPLVFKRAYEEKITEKRVHIIIHQPKVL